MVTKNKTFSVKYILSMVFVLFLFVGFVKNGAYKEIERIFSCLKEIKSKEDAVSIVSVEQDFASTLWMKKDLINLNGLLAKAMHMQGFYSSMKMYITDDNYIVSASDYTSTEYEYEETVAFRDFLESNGINLLYVNEPTKYVDDSLFSRQFGIESYSNRNAERFLGRIRKAGINTIDIRDNIREENINVSDLFYRTDHHWTVPAGLWASKIIAKGLNDYCGYNIDLSFYVDSNYITRSWKSCWLGEQGRKIAESYVGLDDYTEIKPSFMTSYTFKKGDGSTYEGTFDDFINEKVYNTENDVYKNGSWHYSYSRPNCINNNVEKGKILILGDSYDHVTEPFISLGVHETDMLILRNCDKSFSLRNYILENSYDTVIIAYAQFMIGAHDDKKSANYSMFSFDS